MKNYGLILSTTTSCKTKDATLLQLPEDEKPHDTSQKVWLLDINDERRAQTVHQMHEFYYQACIVRTPHTDQARKCYQKYEESIYLAYTGSSGTHIPSRVREKLNQLELASLPQSPKPFEKSELK